MSEIKLILKTRPIWLMVAAVVVALIIGLIVPTGPTFRGPIVDVNDGTMLTIFGISVTAFGLVLAQMYVDRGQMLTRIGKLEDDLQELRSVIDTERGEKRDALADLSAAASFINRIGLAWRQWIVTGVIPKELPQPPEQLTKHGVDVELWDAPVGGTDPN